MRQKTASFKQLILDILFTPVKPSVFMVVVAVVGIYTLGLNKQASQEISLDSQNTISINMDRHPKVLGAETNGEGINNFSLSINIAGSTKVINKSTDYNLEVSGAKKNIKFDFIGLGTDIVDLNLDTLPATVTIVKQDYMLMVFVNGLWQKSLRINKPEYSLNFVNLTREVKFTPRALGAPELLD